MGSLVTTTYVGSLEEVTSSGGTTTTTVYYPGGFAESVNGTISYLASGGLGSPEVALDASGNVEATVLYDPYGTVRYVSGTMPTDLGFTGQHSDASTTGLDYYNARYFDPSTRLFVSADPTLGSGFCRYGYADGNPETLTDPSGLCPARPNLSRTQRIFNAISNGIVAFAMGVNALLGSTLVKSRVTPETREQIETMPDTAEGSNGWSGPDQGFVIIHPPEPGGFGSPPDCSSGQNHAISDAAEIQSTGDEPAEDSNQSSSESSSSALVSVGGQGAVAARAVSRTSAAAKEGLAQVAPQSPSAYSVATAARLEAYNHAWESSYGTVSADVAYEVIAAESALQRQINGDSRYGPAEPVYGPLTVPTGPAVAPGINPWTIPGVGAPGWDLPFDPGFVPEIMPAF